MSKRAADDLRTSALCEHCGRPIRTYRFLNSEWWEHEDDGRVLPGGPYVFCRTTTICGGTWYALTATPTREDESNG